MPTTAISLRLSDRIVAQLEMLSLETDRTRTYLIRKAIDRYLEEWGDYQVALDRLHDKDDRVIDGKEQG